MRTTLRSLEVEASGSGVDGRRPCRALAPVILSLTLCIALGTLQWPAGAAMQDDHGAAPTEGDGVRPPQPTPAPVRSIAELDALRPGRAPLLREGSALVQARGRVEYIAEHSNWKFIVDASEAAAPNHELILLPNASLAELKQVIESAGDRSIAFELTGEVYVFHGRNYLLLTAPVRVLESFAHSPAPAAPDSTDAADPAGEKDESAAGRSRSASDVMRELERSSGPVQRALPTTGRTAATAEHLARDGEIVLQRRGRVTREPSGAWQFVFDADASGGADPPVILLPCLLLERIEQVVQRHGLGTPLLMSGEVTAFDGRNFLLPTSYQIPRERTVLHP